MNKLLTTKLQYNCKVYQNNCTRTYGYSKLQTARVTTTFYYTSDSVRRLEHRPSTSLTTHELTTRAPISEDGKAIKLQQIEDL